MSQVFADVALARRLEATEGRGNAAFVDAQARIDPSSGAIWTTVAGTSAMFAGVGSTITQTFGLGIHQALIEKELDTIEHFFRSRGSAVYHEVCPLAGVDVYAVLARRGYMPIELSTVLYRSIDAERGSLEPGVARPQATAVTRSCADGTIAAQGWSEHPEVMPYIERFAKLSLACATCFFAERDGEPIATAALFMHDGTALLAGASTVPAAAGKARRTRCSTHGYKPRHRTGAISR